MTKPEDINTAILDNCLKEGSRDNMTVCVVLFEDNLRTKPQPSTSSTGDDGGIVSEAEAALISASSAGQADSSIDLMSTPDHVLVMPPQSLHILSSPVHNGRQMRSHSPIMPTLVSCV